MFNDIHQIKLTAKSMVSGNKWNVWKAVLVFIFITFILSKIITSIFHMYGMVKFVFNLIYSVASIPVAYGLSAYNLSLVREKDFSLKTLFDYYPSIVKLLLISFIVGLLVFFGWICLVIPGIIFILWYSMVSFVAVDNKRLFPLEVLKESRELMKGHKVDYILFKLSFIGWDLLAVLTCGVFLIWLLPYKTISEVLFYENLLANK